MHCGIISSSPVKPTWPPVDIMKYKHYFKPIPLISIILVSLIALSAFFGLTTLWQARQIEARARNITAIHWYHDTSSLFEGPTHRVDMRRDGTVYWNKGRRNEAPAPSVDPKDFHKLARRAVEAGFPDFDNQQIYHDQPVATDMDFQTFTVIYKGVPITVEHSSQMQLRGNFRRQIFDLIWEFKQLAGYDSHSER